MKNKVLLLTAMTSLVVSVTAVFTSILLSNDDQPHNIVASEVPTDPNAYDNWCDSWAKQDHAYFHYNRGSSVDVSEYENYCLWLWNQTEDTEGTLWAFSGNPVVSSKLTLIPMSTQFMTRADVGLSDNPNEVYKDDYGVIVDVDLKKSGLKSGKSGSSVTFDGCSELGLLWVKQSSMNGTSHWTSDGGREIYVDDWLENKRNNNSWQLFFSTGALNDYTFRIGEGGGIPEVKINPMNDDLGAYSSKTEKIYALIQNEYFDTAKTELEKLGDKEPEMAETCAFNRYGLTISKHFNDESSISRYTEKINAVCSKGRG